MNDDMMERVKEAEKKLAPRGYNRTGLKLDNYIDNVNLFYETQPFFYDKSQMFWVWNKHQYKYERTDEIDMMNLIDSELGFGGQTVTASIRGNYLESFKRVGRLHIPIEPPKTWVQFKNTIIDVKTGEHYQSTPQYWIVNSIPWELGSTGETPIIDKLFEDWQGTNKNILYEIISYCLICDYPIHTIFAMVGSGRNGKSQYLKIIETLVGIDNITSASLDRITSERFESSKLYKKLVCMMGETNFTALNNTEQLKKLCSGTDPIDFEFKNKNPFTAHNYAKIIINTNSLPTSNDTTDGFYRRWMVINWNNQFKEGKDIVDTIPTREYSELAYKCIDVLRNLLDKGRFTLQGEIEERKQKYIMASNPITLFMQERCEVGDAHYVKAKDLYHAYVQYLQDNKRRIVKRKEFNQLLAEEGYQAEHDKRKVERDGQIEWENSYWFDGLKLKHFSLISPFSPLFPTSCSTQGERVENHREKGENQVYIPFSAKSPQEIKVAGQETKDTTPTFPFEELQSILLDKPQGWLAQEAVAFGFTDMQLRDWMDEGLIFENPSGTLRLV